MCFNTQTVKVRGGATCLHTGGAGRTVAEVLKACDVKQDVKNIDSAGVRTVQCFFLGQRNSGPRLSLLPWLTKAALKCACRSHGVARDWSMALKLCAPHRPRRSAFPPGVARHSLGVSGAGRADVCAEVALGAEEVLARARRVVGARRAVPCNTGRTIAWEHTR